MWDHGPVLNCWSCAFLKLWLAGSVNWVASVLMASSSVQRDPREEQQWQVLWITIDNHATSCVRSWTGVELLIIWLFETLAGRKCQLSRICAVLIAASSVTRPKWDTVTSALSYNWQSRNISCEIMDWSSESAVEYNFWVKLGEEAEKKVVILNLFVQIQGIKT